MTTYRGIVAFISKAFGWFGPLTNELRKSGRANQIDLTVIDAILIDITVLAPDGAVLSVNQFALDRIGLNADEVKSDGYFRRTCHPDDLAEILERRRAGLSNGVRFELDLRLLAKGGSYRRYLAQYNPLSDESEQIVRWYVSVLDIDDRKRFEQ